MSGGAGYVLSREAVRRFVSGHVDQTKCRPVDEGPEDMEMSRCLQRLGVSFIDTRDKNGRYCHGCFIMKRLLDFVQEYVLPAFCRGRSVTA